MLNGQMSPLCYNQVSTFIAKFLEFQQSHIVDYTLHSYYLLRKNLLSP